MNRLAILVVLAACTEHKPIDNLPDSTLPFSPTTVTLQRFATQCGVPHPIFQDSDLYNLTVLGKAVPQGEHRTMIAVEFHRTLPLASELPVMLGAFGEVAYSIDPQGNKTNIVYGQGGTLPMSDNSFEWSQGTDASELDAQPLSVVSVRIDQLPLADGDLGTLTVRMQFTDGSVYDAEISAALFTGLSGCPAG